MLCDLQMAIKLLMQINYLFGLSSISIPQQQLFNRFQLLSVVSGFYNQNGIVIRMLDMNRPF